MTGMETSKSRSCFRTCGLAFAVLVALTATGLTALQQSVWYAGYDLSNCRGCEPTIDWSEERARNVNAADVRQFKRDGVVALRSMLSVSKIAALAEECDRLPNTLMTNVLAAVRAPFVRARARAYVCEVCV